MTEYVIGYLGPVNHFIGFQEAHAAYVALQIFNNKTHPLTLKYFPNINFTISMPQIDTGENELTGMEAAYKLIVSGDYNPDIFIPPSTLILGVPGETAVGLIGPKFSNVAKPLSLFAAIQDVSVLSHAATAIDLSDKATYPSFCRMIPSDNIESKIWGDVIRHFEWTQIAVFTCDTDDCIAFTDSMLKQKDVYGYEVPVVSSITALPVAVANEDEATNKSYTDDVLALATGDIKLALELVRKANLRVIVVADLDLYLVRMIHDTMFDLGMYSETLDNGYVFITRLGSQTIATTLFKNIPVEHQKSGPLTIRYQPPSFFTDLYAAGMWNEWSTHSNSFITEVCFPQVDEIANIGSRFGWAAAGATMNFESTIPMGFDAVKTYFSAIYDLESSGTEVTRSALKDYIPGMTTPGASGSIAFDENCDRTMQFQLLNLRDDVPVIGYDIDKNSSYHWVGVATWSPPEDGEVFGSVTLDSSNPINFGTGDELVGQVPPDWMIEESSNDALSKESLILIALGSVGGMMAIVLFIRYLRRHCANQEGSERFDANKEHRRRILMDILKQTFCFGLEVADYVSDALSAEVVFGLLSEDVISPVFVVIYLCVICIGGLANFGNCIARMKNFIDLIKEYTAGVAMNTAALEGSSSDVSDVKLLRDQNMFEDVSKLEDLTVKLLEVERQTRIEKFTFMLGFVEDLPICIMNSVLLLSYREDIDYQTIYASTLFTLIGFGVKMMSLEKIIMLKSETKYMKQHVRLQRTSSVNIAKSKAAGNSEPQEDHISVQI